MDSKTNDAMMRNFVFVWIAFATGLILLIPLIAMQFSNEVNWDKKDFVVMGFLLFGMGSLFVLVSRRVSRKRRAAVGTLFVAAFFYIWAELAVGIFTGLGS